MNKSIIVKAMAKFKMDVYANLASKDEIKSYLTNTLKMTVWSGQKRLVVIDNRVVYKIAYSDQGILDNIMEVACSHKLRELHQAGKISTDDLSLFGLAELVDGDPFIVAMPEATNYIVDPDFIQWYQRFKASKPDFNENQLFPLYVIQHPSLLKDHNRRERILSEFFVPSDATIFKAPKNFCLFRDSNGVQRSVLIDMGSICPTLVRGGRAVIPTCEKCGAEKIYVPYELSPNMSFDKALNLEGIYLCKNPSCPDFYAKAATGDIHTTSYSKDSYVYSKYIQDNRDLVRRLRAIDGLYFIPNRRVASKHEYRMEITSTLGLNPSPEILELLYKNYQSFACGILSAAYNSQIKSLPLIANNTIVPFGSYLAAFNNMIASYGEPIDSISQRTAALIYLAVICEGSNDISMFDTLTQPDLATFSRVLNTMGIDPQNGMLLFNSINAR